jgi:hypothetical protein
LTRTTASFQEMPTMEIPGPLAELTKAFREYEAALVSNRPDVLDRPFLNSPVTIRYGVAENLYGHAEISAYRSRRAQAGGAPQRKIAHEVITTFGKRCRYGQYRIRPGGDWTGRSPVPDVDSHPSRLAHHCSARLPHPR